MTFIPCTASWGDFCKQGMAHEEDLFDAAGNELEVPVRRLRCQDCPHEEDISDQPERWETEEPAVDLDRLRPGAMAEYKKHQVALNVKQYKESMSVNITVLRDAEWIRVPQLNGQQALFKRTNAVIPSEEEVAADEARWAEWDKQNEGG